MTAKPVDSLRPGPRLVWLRPAALVMAVGLHIGAGMFLTVPRPDLSAPDDAIELTIAQGTPEVEQPPEPPAPPEPPEVKPEPPPPPPPPPEPPPPPPPELPPPPPPPEPVPPPVELPPPPVVAPPKVEAPDAAVIAPPPKPKPQPKPVQKAPPPKPQDPPPAPPPPPASEPIKTGITEQPTEAQVAQARATYASKLLQEIRSHRLPAIGAGTTQVAFIVNAQGEMTQVHIVRSSGNTDLDAIALRMVQAAHPGPPPDGTFPGSTSINFLEK